MATKDNNHPVIPVPDDEPPVLAGNPTNVVNPLSPCERPPIGLKGGFAFTP